MLKVDISATRHPGAILLLDEQDAHLLDGVRWTPDGRRNGLIYAHRRPDASPKLYIHRLIMRPKPGLVVDHIDRNGLNNCRANLRVVQQRVNVRNRGATAGSSSGFKGVWRKRDRWSASIARGGESYLLGTFDDETAAARVYDAAALALDMDRIGLNFPDEDTSPRLDPIERLANEWGYPGVRRLPSGRFGVRLIKGSQRYSLGTTFATAEEAVAAAWEAENAS